MSKWIHCPNCGHRLFFLRDGAFSIEIKCTSCKKIMNLEDGNVRSNGGIQKRSQTSVLRYASRMRRVD